MEAPSSSSSPSRFPFFYSPVHEATNQIHTYLTEKGLVDLDSYYLHVSDNSATDKCKLLGAQLHKLHGDIQVEEKIVNEYHYITKEWKLIIKSYNIFFITHTLGLQKKQPPEFLYDKLDLYELRFHSIHEEQSTLHKTRQAFFNHLKNCVLYLCQESSWSKITLLQDDKKLKSVLDRIDFIQPLCFLAEWPLIAEEISSGQCYLSNHFFRFAQRLVINMDCKLSDQQEVDHKSIEKVHIFAVECLHNYFRLREQLDAEFLKHQVVSIEKPPIRDSILAFASSFENFKIATVDYFDELLNMIEAAQ